MTQAASVLYLAIDPMDVLWIRLRVAALLGAAQEMAKAERWHLSYVVTGDAYTFYDLCRRGAECARLRPVDLSAARFAAWAGRAADLSKYPSCANAYRDIVQVLSKYSSVRREKEATG